MHKEVNIRLQQGIIVINVSWSCVMLLFSLSICTCPGYYQTESDTKVISYQRNKG